MDRENNLNFNAFIRQWGHNIYGDGSAILTGQDDVNDLMLVAIDDAFTVHAR